MDTKLNILKGHQNRGRIKERTKSRLTDLALYTHVVLIYCFRSFVHLKTEVEGTCELNLLQQYSYLYASTHIAPKEYERSIASASFRQSFTRNR